MLLVTKISSFSQFVFWVWTFVILIFAFTFTVALAPKLWNTLLSIMATVREKNKKSPFKKSEEAGLLEMIEAAGYSYDHQQDIFYSNLYPWQRDMGYCRLYDEAAAALGIIMDCEPIYFEYDNKLWLIEFWKGQYGIATGCEIGVYVTDEPSLDIAGVFNGTFYYAVGDEDLLQMSFTLKKKERELFKRSDKHWWLTGFMLGEFSELWELSMNIQIELHNDIMLNAFIKGLINAGYAQEDIINDGNTISIVFNQPRTKQPFTRRKYIESLMQGNNKGLCLEFNELTRDCNNSLESLMLIKERAPDLLDKVLGIGKVREVFSSFNDIKKHLK